MLQGPGADRPAAPPGGRQAHSQGAGRTTACRAQTCRAQTCRAQARCTQARRTQARRTNAPDTHAPDTHDPDTHTRDANARGANARDPVAGVIETCHRKAGGREAGAPAGRRRATAGTAPQGAGLKPLPPQNTSVTDNSR